MIPPGTLLVRGWDGRVLPELSVYQARAVAMTAELRVTQERRLEGHTLLPDDGFTPGLEGVADVRAGESGWLVQFEDGRVLPGGVFAARRDDAPWVSFPTSFSNVIAIAAADHHALYLDGRGRVESSGSQAAAECEVPADATNIVEIAAVQRFSMARRADGRVFAWGADSTGRSRIPASLTNAVGIAASATSSYVLDADGQVWAFGGEAGAGRVIPDLGPVVKIAATPAALLVLRADGTMKALNHPGVLDRLTQVAGLWAQVGGDYGAFVRGVVLADGERRVLAGETNATPGTSLTLHAHHLPAAGERWQWYRDGAALSGQTGAVLQLSGLRPADSGHYHARWQAGGAEELSPPYIVRVGMPSFREQPADVLLTEGGEGSMAVAVDSPEEPVFAWTVNGEPIVEWNLRTGVFPVSPLDPATNAPFAYLNGPYLPFLNVRPEAAGLYQVVASTSAGSITSRVARVEVRPAPKHAVWQPEVGSVTGLRDDDLRYELAQTFKAAVGGRVQRILVGGGFTPGVPWPTTIEIRDADGIGRPGTNRLGHAIWVHLFEAPVLDFFNDAVLEAGKLYALVLRTDAPMMPHVAAYGFSTSLGDVYPEGHLWRRIQPSGPWVNTAKDLSFAVEVVADPVGVRLVAPLPHAAVSGHPVPLRAAVTAGTNLVDGVTIRVNGTPVAQLPAPPFEASWTPATAGDFVVTAEVAFAGGTVLTSEPQTVQVRDQRPANDDFAQARLLGGGQAVETLAALDGATREPGEPAGPVGGTLWWRCQPAVPGEVAVQTLPANTNLHVAVFQGSELALLSPVTAGAGGCRFVAQGDAPFYVALTVPPGTASTGTLAMAVQDLALASPPEGTAVRADAVVGVTGTRLLADRRWAKTLLRMDGAPVADWTAGPLTAVLTNLVPGRRVLDVEVTDELGLTTRSAGRVLVVRPVNDRFADALTVSGRHFRVETSNAAATTELPGGNRGEPLYGSNQGGHSIWYRWTAPADGLCYLNGTGLPGGVMIGAYVGSRAEALQQIASNWSGAGPQGVGFNAVAGTTYTIMVDGLNGGEGPLAWTLDLYPGNDAFDQRATVASLPQGMLVRMDEGSLEPGEAGLVWPGMDSSYWWAVPVSEATRLVVRAEADQGVVSVAVFTGGRFRRLEPVVPATAPAAVATLAFAAETGQTYVVGVFGAGAGTARLQLSTEGVRLVAPVAGATLRVGATTAVEAVLDVPDDLLERLEFFLNGQPLGEPEAGRRTLAWPVTDAGSFTLRVRATLASGAVHHSPPVSVLAYDGEFPPAPRLFSGPGWQGAVVAGAAGAWHLLGLPAGNFGHADATPMGAVQVAAWPAGVSDWTAVVVQGAPFDRAPMLTLSVDGVVYEGGVRPLPLPAGVRRFVSLRNGWGPAVAVGDNGVAYAGATTPLDLPAQPLTDAIVNSSGTITLAPDGRAYLHARGTFGERVTQEVLRPSGVARWEAIHATSGGFLLTDPQGEVYQAAPDTWAGGPVQPVRVARPAGVGRWQAVAAGGFHVLALGDDGHLYAWGRNWEGQLGTGAGAGDFTAPARVKTPPGVTAWTAVAAGWEHSAAIGNDCTLYAWGLNDRGQLGRPAGANIFEPLPVPLAAGVCGELVIASRNPAERLPDGTFRLFLPTVRNRNYEIQYSDDFQNWRTAAGRVTGTGGVVEWVDSGPPRTEALPAATALRIYRVVLVP